MTSHAYRPDALIATDIDAYLARHQEKSLLRFLTCGSVDDGKSTLIGRLLYDAQAIFDDQLSSLEADSKRLGTQGANIDFALLVDGLAAEREQGITIDVAYRFFTTDRRKFIVADTPGHEQYTRNMVTGASTADVAVILIDARKGVLTQTRRHGFLVNLLGIRHVVLAVNKMDLIGWDRAAFDAIVADFGTFAASIGMTAPVAIPISGLGGDNIASGSANTPWYDGPTLLAHLETVEIDADREAAKPFAMPVQWVSRPNLDFRGFAGLVTSGTVKPGDLVRIVPSGRTTSIARIVTLDGDLDQAGAGQSVTLTLADEVDCSRGDVIAAADSPPEVADQFAATIVWMDEAPLLPGRAYWLKTGAATVSASIRPPEHAIDVNSLAHLSVKTLGLNDIGVAHVHTDRAIPFAPYAQAKDLGGFILIDKLTNATVAAGMIDRSLRRAQNVHWQAIEITRDAHAAQKNQAAKLLWFTGLSGSGKSTIANLVEKKLHALGKHSFLLDGDNVRHGLNRDLGFSDADRVENIRRVGEVARLMTDAGLIVLTAFISPFRAERKMVRALIPEGEFLEIFIDTPIELAEERDVKGLYAKARAGEIAHFTGISSPYEPPEAPDIRVDTTRISPEDAAELIVDRVIGMEPGDMNDAELARAVAQEAGALLLQLQRGGTFCKAMGDEGDRSANALILDRLRAARPGAFILSEESEDDLARCAASRVWVVDPLDGTAEFAAGRDDWAVHIGLSIDGAPAVGAVALPARGELLCTETPALPRTAPSGPRIVVSRSRPPAEAVRVADTLGGTLIPMGSAGAKAMAVVMEADIYLHSGGQYAWDSCAPAAVALAAGLHVSRLDGSPLVYNCAETWLPDLLICAKPLASRVLALVAGA